MKRKKIFLCLLISSILFCFGASCGNSSESEQDSSTENEIISIESTFNVENSQEIKSYSYASPDDEYTLYAALHVNYDMDPLDSITFSSAYVFYWMEEGELTEPLAVVDAETYTLDTSAQVNEATYRRALAKYDKLLSAIQEDADAIFDETNGSRSITWNREDAAVEFRDSKNETHFFTFAYPDHSVHTQTITQDVQSDDRPEVVSAQLTGNCKGKLEKKAYLKISGHVMTQSVVGGVGNAVEVYYTEEVAQPVLTFCYEESQLRGIPEQNLLVLHFIEDPQHFEEMTEAVLDADANTVTIPIAEEGYYLLTDIYQWYTVWGKDAAAYAYERDLTAYPSDWERSCDTGDIMKLADIDWAMEQAPEFHVATPEQLAGVVYYVNAIAKEEIYLYLENDLDLSGYAWTPMGWRKAGCNRFYINGMGHTISNMTIDVPEMEEVGWIGYADYLEAYDLSFVNASVTGKDYVGIFCGVDYKSDVLENISAAGTVISDGNSCGSLLGSENGGMKYRNCSADVTVNGFEFPYFSSYQKKQADAEPYALEAFMLTVDENYCITRDEAEGYDNLGWEIYRDGERVLSRNAENETVLNTKEISIVGANAGSDYKIYLTAWINGTYVRVSNIVEYTVP